MIKLDSYEVFDKIKEHAKNGGIIYTVLNDNYTPAAMIYDYILFNRETKGATIYKYIARMGRIYTQRKYSRLPQTWLNKVYITATTYGDTAEGYTDYKELYSDLCE